MDNQGKVESMKGDIENAVFEVGFLLVPTIAEENLGVEVQNIKALIEKNQGTFISEDFPKMRQLAYTIAVASEGKKTKYSQAYFGWIKFEVSPEAISAIRSELGRNQNIIRFLLIDTVRENTLASQKMTFRPPTTTDKKKPEDENAAPVSQEELDKTIESLVVQ